MIGNAQIVSYGAYETRYLREMKGRYVQAGADDAEFVDRIIEASINLVACVYGKVYFPTFSNSLKEVGRYLGFEWSWPQASGGAAVLLRRAWKFRKDDKLKSELVDYNMDDCRAAAMVANALMRVSAGGEPGLNTVDVSSPDAGFQHAFGNFFGALSGFTKINDAACWDYRRDKIYVRSNPRLRRAAKIARRKRNRLLRANTTVDPSRRCKCPACDSEAYF